MYRFTALPEVRKKGLPPDIHYLEGAYYVNRPGRSYITYHHWNVAIDNIVVSEGFTEITSGLLETESSDHSLLYAEFQFSGVR